MVAIPRLSVAVFRYIYNDGELSDILSLLIVYLSFQAYIQVVVESRGGYYTTVAILLGFYKEIFPISVEFWSDFFGFAATK